MNRTIAIFTLCLNILTLIGCSSKKANDETSSLTDSTAVVSDSADTLTVLPADDSLPYVDLTKTYPLKKIDLREVADIKYVQLETTDKSLVSYPSKIYLRDGKILFEEFKSQEVLAFNEDGTFFTKISRQGGGPQEYRYILNSCVDFDNELVYIWDLTFPPKIKVYDYDGYMQREFTVSDIPTPDAMYLFDENRLIVHCDPDPTSEEAQIVGSYPYRFIDIHTGKTTPVDIEIPDAVSNKISKRSGEYISVSSISINPMLKRNNEVIVSDYTYPIVYLQQGSQLKPLVRKSECSRSDTKETMSVVRAITDRYILFYVATKSIDRDKCTVSIEKETELLYDRKTKEVNEVEFINPDTGKSVRLSWSGDMPRNTIVKTYAPEVLDLYNNKGYLSGKLKDIAEQMDPEDNPVLAIITFK
ncbi:MAG: 6-bladed beta-propeller [Paramuribaculum sp.]|nr:6-bladed beta-propeller [Paramuribaculum sp.]